MKTANKYRFVYFLVSILGFMPGRVVSVILRNVAPRSWAPGWSGSVCLEVLEDVLLYVTPAVS